MKDKIRLHIRKIISESYGMSEPNFTSSSLDGKNNAQARNIVTKIAEKAHHSGMYNDQAWVGPNSIMKAFNDTEIQYEILSADYFNWPPKDSTSSSGKEWKLRFPFVNNKGIETVLHGTITAAGAGSVQDPLDRYDVTFTVF